MFQRFTERARRVVVVAQDEARMLDHNHIGSEHLLLGLLHEQDSMAAHVLGAAGVTLEAARAEARELAGAGSKSPVGNIPFTPQAKRILELSLREALEQKSDYIGSEHILLAVIREADGGGARILDRLGQSLSALRQQVLEAAKAARPRAVAEQEGAPAAGALNLRLTQVYSREASVQPQSVSGFRGMLTLIDRRLATIERHLGIAASGELAGGFRGLVASVDRRLAAIERHLRVTPAEGTAGEGTDDEG